MNSCSRGHALLNDTGPVETIVSQLHGWLNKGRFFPVSALSYLVNYFFNNLTIYRVFLLSLILLNILQFSHLLRLWNVPRAAAQLGCLSAVLLLQTRVFCDPILAFGGLLQILTAELFAAILGLQKYLNTRRAGWLAASVAAYSLALLTYEISAAALPVFGILAWTHFRRWPQTFAALRPYATVAALLAVFLVGLRYHMPRDEQSAYQPRLDPPLIVRTALYQASGALPMSYPLLNLWNERRSEHPGFGAEFYPSKEAPKHILSKRRLFGRFGNWLVFLAAGGLTWALLRQSRSEAATRKAPLGLLLAGGMALWILPGVPIAFSPKYQDWVRPGFSYLPVYLQYFGVAMLFTAILQWLITTNARHKSIVAYGLVGLNAVVGMVTFDTTRFVTRCLRDSPDSFSRDLIERALSAGLADAAKEGDTIWTKKRYIWATAWGPTTYGGHFTQCLHRKINTVTGPAAPGWLPDPAVFPQIAIPSFELHDHCTDYRNGYVVLSPLAGADRAAAPAGLTTRVFRAYLRGSFLQAAASPGKLTFAAHSAAGGSSEERTAVASSVTLVRAAPDGAIYQGVFAEPVEAATIQVTTENDHPAAGHDPAVRLAARAKVGSILAK